MVAIKPVRRKVHFRAYPVGESIPTADDAIVEWLGEDPRFRRISDGYTQQQGQKDDLVLLRIATEDIPENERDGDVLLETLQSKWARTARKPDRRKFPKHRQGRITLVTATADDQAGKSDIYGGTPELMQRNADLLASITDYVEELRPDAIVNLHGGDLIENVNNVSAQRASNDLSLTRQIEAGDEIRGMWIEALGQYAPVAHGAPTSNHGRNRMALGVPADNPGDDYGVMIERIVHKRALAAGLDVTLIEADNEFDEWVLVPIYETVLGLIHGHEVKGGAAGIKNFMKLHSGNRSPLARVDHLLMAHNHDEFDVSLGRGANGYVRRAIGLAPMDGGSAWFQNLTGADSDPGATTFIIREGTGYDSTSLKRWHRPVDLEIRRAA
jgi:hypothetical protein